MNQLLSQAWTLWLLLVAAGAWVAYAQHPTAANLRRAIADTLPVWR